MQQRWLLAALMGGVIAAVPGALFTQSPFAQAAPKSKQGQRAQPLDPDLEVEELTPGQIRRAQDGEQRTSPRNAEPKTTAPGLTAPAQAPSAGSATPDPPSGRAVACSGVFGKDSTHLKLAIMYKTDNVAFTEVDGPGGSKIIASVLFPNDPKRRLEVWWQNPASRSGIHLIVIGGQSTWSVPKGLKLGLQLPAIEKLNGRPFKLKGFGKSDLGEVSDWQDGALAALPGRCKVGASLKLDAKTPAEARADVASDKEFESTDAAIRAGRPAISEIILGY